MHEPPGLKIDTAGIRGIVGEFLTPQIVASFASAFGSYCGRRNILVGTDARPSSEMVTQAALAGLLSVGCTPVHLGIVPSPVLQHHVRAVGAGGGVCVSASYNPLEWNVLKFIGSDGVHLRPNHFRELRDLYDQGVYPRVGALDVADVRQDDTALLRHRQTILAGLDADRIRARRFKVVVDCCQGAASRSAPEFLRALGCDVVEPVTKSIADSPGDTDPTAARFGDLGSQVNKTRADLGFVLAPDADRLTVVDEKGVPLNEDSTVGLAVRHFLRREQSPVVVNVSTSRMVEAIAAASGCPVFRTPVGEVHVVRKMLECGALIGGEGDGGVIAPNLNPCRDGFVGMALLLESLAEEGTTTSQLRGLLPAGAIVRRKLPCRPRYFASSLRLLKHHFEGQELDLTDGMKVVWKDRWLHVRGCSAEPALQIVAEAPTRDEAMALLAGVIKSFQSTAE